MFMPVRQADGRVKIMYIARGNFIFEQMSPADVWNVIASAARGQLYRVPVPTKRKPRKDKRA